MRGSSAAWAWLTACARLSSQSVRFADMSGGAAPASATSASAIGPRLLNSRCMDEMTDTRERWALILGASSGFGGASGLSLARAGYPIVGVHLDLRGTIANAQQVREDIAATGVPVVFHNVNAADEGKRHAVVEATRTLFDERRAEGKDPFIAVLLHSLAFGTTLS